jgi:hypothetical protein
MDKIGIKFISYELIELAYSLLDFTPILSVLAYLKKLNIN